MSQEKQREGRRPGVEIRAVPQPERHQSMKTPIGSQVDREIALRHSQSAETEAPSHHCARAPGATRQIAFISVIAQALFGQDALQYNKTPNTKHGKQSGPMFLW